jgi:hypothetical protein
VREVQVPQIGDITREMAMPILAKMEGAVLMNDPLMLGSNNLCIIVGYIHHLEECLKYGAQP